MTDLVQRLRAAQEPSRELADEVLLALGWQQLDLRPQGPLAWQNTGDGMEWIEHGGQPDPLTSTDALLSCCRDFEERWFIAVRIGAYYERIKSNARLGHGDIDESMILSHAAADLIEKKGERKDG